MAARGPLSILHVSQPTDGGVANYVADVAADQTARGLRVVVASPAWGDDLGARLEASGARHVDWTAGRAPGPSSFLDARRLARIIGDEEPALVHLHSSKAGLAGRLALRGRLPTIFQPHAWSFEAARGPLRTAALAWERRAASWGTILCVSEAERRRGEEHGVRANWRVIPNAVDLDEWRAALPEDRSAARRDLELDDRPTVVCVGRLCRQKGQDILLDAWPEVAERLPGARLVLVGDGPDANSLRNRAGEGVRLVGRRGDVGQWLAAADVVALPSRWEGMSIGMLEAMAKERSVVASDVPGAEEALDDDAGALVPPEDPAALANALAERLLDPAKAAAEGRRGRERVERSHDLRAMTAALATLYEELLDAVSSSTGRTTL
jgi:glycosyltransferase involved in cell wall biosynthesis